MELVEWDYQPKAHCQEVGVKKFMVESRQG